MNGTLGSNNWYVSNTTLTAIGQDDTSGIYEALLSVDGGAYTPTTTLSDGIYQVDILARDNAFNTSNASTTLQVDTVTPTLSLTVSGTKGENGFYTSSAAITPTFGDATSGVDRVEVSIDGGARQVVTTPVTLSDGLHTYQFSVYDKAGNFTENPVQQISIDTIPPAIVLTDRLDLGDTFEYSLQDDGSGLAVVRIVIEDEDERFPKVAWQETISGNKFKDEFVWDGRWKDKSYAIAGEYFITVKASDAAGNERISYGVVNVNPISYLLPIPEFIPSPSAEAESSKIASEEEPIEQNFGGATAPNDTGSTTQTLILNDSATAGATNANTNNTNILWGAIAASAIGMATAYALEQQKKRKEEEESSYQQAVNQTAKLNEVEEQKKKVQLELQRQAILAAQQEDMEQKMKEAAQADMTEMEKWEAYFATPEYRARQARLAEWERGQAYERHRQAEISDETSAKWQQAEEKKKAQDLQDGLAAYYAATRQGEQIGAPKVLVVCTISNLT